MYDCLYVCMNKIWKLRFRPVANELELGNFECVYKQGDKPILIIIKIIMFELANLETFYYYNKIS